MPFDFCTLGQYGFLSLFIAVITTLPARIAEPSGLAASRSPRAVVELHLWWIFLTCMLCALTWSVFSDGSTLMDPASLAEAWLQIGLILVVCVTSIVYLCVIHGLNVPTNRFRVVYGLLGLTSLVVAGLSCSTINALPALFGNYSDVALLAILNGTLLYVVCVSAIIIQTHDLRKDAPKSTLPVYREVNSK